MSRWRPGAHRRVEAEAEGGWCYQYEPKRGAVQVLTAEELVKRLLVLVPPARMHLTHFWGVFAPNAKRRPAVVSQRAVRGDGSRDWSPLRVRLRRAGGRLCRQAGEGCSQRP